MPITLEVTNGFGPTTARGKLDVLACTITESLDGNDVMTARIKWPAATAVQMRSTLRLTDDDGGVTEWRVNRLVEAQDGSGYADLTGAPPLADLATCGVVQQVIGTLPVTKFIAMGAPSTIIAAYLLTNLPSPINVWLDTTLGTIEPTASLTMDIDGQTWLQVLRSIEASTNSELQLVRQVSGRYRICLWTQRGSTVPKVPVTRGRNLLQYSTDTEDANVVSVVMPLGEPLDEVSGDGTIAENAWVVRSVDASGWAVLSNAENTYGPVGFNDQYNGKALEWDGGTGALRRTAILDTRLSDNAVQVSPTAGLTAGSIVSIVLSTAGDPLTRLDNPALVDSDVGRVEQALAVTGGRAERNYVRNAELQDGSAGVSAGTSGAVIPRSALDVTRTFAANGTRPMGTTPATAFPVDGLAPGEWLYRGDQIRVGGVTLTITADAIANAQGQLVLTVSAPGLPGDLPAGSPITLIRKRTRTMQVDGTQSAVGFGVRLKAIDTDNMPSGQHYVTDSYLQIGGVFVNTNRYWSNGGITYRYPQLAVADVSGGPGKKRLYVQSAGIGFGVGHYLQAQSPLPGTYTYGRFGAANLEWDSALQRVSVFWAAEDVYQIALMTVGVTRLCLLDVGCTIRRANGELRYVQHITGVFHSSAERTSPFFGTWVTMTLDPDMLDAGDTIVTVYNNGVSGLRNAIWSNTTWTDGATVQLEEVKETRAFTLNAAHVSGATTITTAPLPALARRDFQTGDVISLRRRVTGTLRITGVSSTFSTYTDPEDGSTYSGWAHVITYDAALSTFDDLPFADYQDALVGIGGVEHRFTSPITNPFTISSEYNISLATPITITLEIEKKDDYTVTGAASWGTNGKATVPVSVPSGRSHGYGDVVHTNFHGTPVRWLNGQGWSYPTSLLRLGAAVTGPASSLVIEGTDSMLGVSPWGFAWAAEQLAPVYQVRGNSGSAIPVEGELLNVKDSVQANGSGQANIMLRSANTITIPDNAQLVLTRPALVTGSALTTGNVVRLLGTAWDGGDGTVRFAAMYLRVGTSARTATVRVWFLLNVPHSPSGFTVALVAGTPAAPGAVIATVTVPAVSAASGPQQVVVTTQGVVSADGYYHLAVTGGGGHTLNHWYTIEKVLVSLTDDAEVPFVRDSHANDLIRAGNTYLLANASEKRAITCTVAQFATATGLALPLAAQQPGVTLAFEDTNDMLRIYAVTRDLLDKSKTVLKLETLQRTIARLLGTGMRSTSNGTATAVSGSGSAVTNPTPTPPPTIIVSGNNVLCGTVSSGGDWVMGTTGLNFTVGAGTGILQSGAVAWDQTTITVADVNSVVYVDANGRVTSRPETVPGDTPNEIALFTVLVWGTPKAIQVVMDCRTKTNFSPKAPLQSIAYIKECVVTSGAWQHAVAVAPGGHYNPYFANVALMPFVESLPDVTKNLLDLQIAKFYGLTGTGSADWTTLHGTTWSGYYAWPYDVQDPSGTPTKSRADSHDSYAGTFVRLAVRYARRVPGGLTWWDANVGAIQTALYYNMIVRTVSVTAGALVSVFQDPAVYPFALTMDTMECWRALKEARELMIERGGSQATWASTYASWQDSMLTGIQSQWSDGDNGNGDFGWLSWLWDITNSVRGNNALVTIYPDLMAGVMCDLYDVPLSPTSSVARARLAKAWADFQNGVPAWYAGRPYNGFPQTIFAAAAARAGFRQEVEHYLAFLQSHYITENSGYFQIQDHGWVRLAERYLAADPSLW